MTFLIYNPVVSDAYFESQSRIRFSVITEISTCCVCLVGNELEGGGNEWKGARGDGGYF